MEDELILIVDGKERVGMSTMGIEIGKYIEEDLN